MRNSDYEKCSRCKIKRNKDQFGSDPTTKDKLDYCCKICRRQYYLDNKERIDAKNKRYNEINKEKMKEYHKQYRLKNKEKIKGESTKYYRENSIKINEQRKIRRQIDLMFRLTENIRCRFYQWLNNFKKDKRTFEYINCTKEELIEHLESQFQEGMSWDNYGKGHDKWQIDHIIPLSKFDKTNEEDMHKAWAKENLQPLWCNDNWSKNNRTN